MPKSSYTNKLHAQMYDTLHEGFPDLVPGPNGEPPNDAAFYLKQIGQAPKSILELGCGTARVAIPLAEAGHCVIGLDASPVMLEIARHKVESLPDEVQERIQLIESDWSEYDLDQRFDAIVCPFTSFQRNMTTKQQDRWLHCAHRHLIPSTGLLILDLFFPSYKRLVDLDEPRKPGRKIIWQGVEWHEHETVTRDHAAQSMNVCLDYEPVDGSHERIEHRFDLTWFFPREIERMLTANKFKPISILDGYSGDPVRSDSSRQVAIAVPME